MSATGPRVTKRHGNSPGVVIGLAAAALVGWAAGGIAVGVLFILLLLAYLFAPRTGHEQAGADLAGRVELLEQHVGDLQRVVIELAQRQTSGGTAAWEREPVPQPEPEPQPTPAPPTAAPAPPPAPPRPPQAEQEPPPAAAPAGAGGFDWGRTISAADLMGAKALAFAGGVVTLLGVVFFFVLAVNRGWIGPELRVAFGGVASALIFGCGLWLQRRYEPTYSALVAVGTGIAGAYATLLAAVALYDLLPKPVALVIAAAIAGVGVVVSLAWEAEIVAGFGLVGAMIVPATLALQGGLQELGTAFVAVMFAAATVVAVRQRWWILLQVSAVVSVPQALAQIGGAETPHASIVVLAGVYWLLYLAAGLAFQFRLGAALAARPASFLVADAVFAGVAAALLYGRRDGDLPQGVALLIASAVYIALAGLLYRRARETATLLGALGLSAAGVGLGEAISGSSLTYAWAVEAALLVWLSVRVRDARFQLPAVIYLVLALAHTVVTEASPDHLFESTRHPARGALAVLAVALAAVVFGRVKRLSAGFEPSQGVLRVLDPVLVWLRARDSELTVGAFGLAMVLGAYAASLGILELCQDVWPGDGLVAPFEWGHVVVNSAWALAGLTLVVLAVRRGSKPMRALGFGWLTLTVAKVVAFDATTLADTRYAISFLAVGGVVLLAALTRELAVPVRLTVEGVASLVISLALLVVGALVLVPDRVGTIDGNGLVVTGAGALYTILAGATLRLRRQRDLTTMLWSLGLATAAVGEYLLLEGGWLVLTYALSSAALSFGSVVLHERRFQAASLAYLALAGLHVLAVEAPFSHLVVARAHPAHGLPSLLLVIAATATLAWALAWNGRYRLQGIWIAGALTVYACSLAILEATQQLSHQGVHTDFQRGHTLVSSFWGVLALVSLYVGLKRRRRLLRVGGFVLFAVSLGKLFLFDLPSLSSIERAFSFLAVGAVLLLGGFFYQRLSAQYDERVA